MSNLLSLQDVVLTLVFFAILIFENVISMAQFILNNIFA